MEKEFFLEVVELEQSCTLLKLKYWWLCNTEKALVLEALYCMDPMPIPTPKIV